MEDKLKDEKKCTIWWCRKPHYAHGYCITHYRANDRYGSPYGRVDEIHFIQYKRIDKVVHQARTVSKALLGILGILGPECPYCHEIEIHKPDCPVYDAQLILEQTK